MAETIGPHNYVHRVEQVTDGLTFGEKESIVQRFCSQNFDAPWELTSSWIFGFSPSRA